MDEFFDTPGECNTDTIEVNGDDETIEHTFDINTNIEKEKIEWHSPFRLGNRQKNPPIFSNFLYTNVCKFLEMM